MTNFLGTRAGTPLIAARSLLEDTLTKELTNLRVSISVKTTQKVVTESALRRLRVGSDPEEVELVWRREMRRAEG